VVCRDSQSRLWPGPAHPYGGADTWFAQLGEELIEVGLMRVRPYHPDGTLRRASHGGQACSETDGKRRGEYAYFRLAETFPREGALSDVSVVIEYYDNAIGSNLVLEYDAASGAYTGAAPVQLSGGGKWKTATFRISSSNFHGRQNDGADFRLSIQDPHRPLAIRSVRVERSAGRH